MPMHSPVLHCLAVPLFWKESYNRTNATINHRKYPWLSASVFTRISLLDKAVNRAIPAVSYINSLFFFVTERTPGSVLNECLFLVEASDGAAINYMFSLYYCFPACVCVFVHFTSQENC
ncbi:hypothetical protein XENORESO_003618 [Xenotaenia resolanae]|uniref:Uncharacterized protein n=1 Tax=Xenotaenia resolanae TaxID=208358 RepID=A0ABV0VRE1_9TELE